MIKAIIFDFDGIIADTEPQRFDEVKKLLKKYNYELSNNLFKDFIGQKTSFFLKNQFPNISSKIIDKIVEKRRETQLKNVDKISLIQGIAPLLKFLNTQYKIAITTGSSKKIVNPILIKHRLENYFEVIITGDSFLSSKPLSECFEITLKKLNLKPNEVIIIEDSGAGIAAAKDIDCKVFALKNKYNDAQIKGADKIFKSHKEILKYFRSI